MLIDNLVVTAFQGGLKIQQRQENDWFSQEIC